MKVGDHVQIIGREHPWAGERGIIVSTFEGHGLLEWTVELDGGDYPGQRSAAASSDLRVVGDSDA